MTALSGLDIEKVRKDFPVLSRKVHGKPLVYFDNAATAQKPNAVIQAMDHYYRDYNSNIHRGVHALSSEATVAYDEARETVAQFIHAKEAKEVIFTQGTTHAINLVAHSWGRTYLKPGDEIVLSIMEHHSNIVPWQMVAEAMGAVIQVIPMDDRGVLDLEAFRNLLSSKTKLVAVGHVSNALGTIHPVKQMVQMAKAMGAVVVIDGAQAVPHLKVDVQDIGCDFYAFSGHKLFGPTGVGVLWGHADLLNVMPPYQGGGDMIMKVSFEKTTYQQIPERFEAGTPNIAGVVGLKAGIDYLNDVGLEAIHTYEAELLQYAQQQIAQVPGIRIIGTAPHKVPVISFLLEDIHPHDIGTILDLEGVAIRTGHHCTQPLMRRLGVAATGRVSLAFYNTKTEVDVFVKALEKVRKRFLE